jgi:hypothetical protein
VTTCGAKSSPPFGVTCEQEDTLDAHLGGHSGRNTHGTLTQWGTTLQERRRWADAEATLTAYLIRMVSGNWSDRNLAVNRIVARIEAIEARQRANRQHDPGCGRAMDMIADCNCWLSKEKVDG